MDRHSQHPVSHNLSGSELDRLVENYKSRGLEFVKNLSILWDLETDFSRYHDISDGEFQNGLEVREIETARLKTLIGLPNWYHSENLWKTHRQRETAGVIYAIENEVSLTPPWMVTGSPNASLYVRSGHNRFAIALINFAQSMPILLTSSDATLYDLRA